MSWNVFRQVKHLRVAPATAMAASLLALMLATTVGSAQASPNLVTNGNFEQTSLTPTSTYTSFQLGSWSYNSTAYTGSLTDWTNQSGAYNYVFTSGTATALGQYGNLSLADGSAIANSPVGGNFIGNDGDFNSGTISQTINGLTVGAPATLTFWWGAGIQNGFTIPNTENWTVSLCPTSGCVGNDTQNAPSYTLTAVDFSGWMYQTLTFIPTSATEVLSFLAVGTGSPPFLLLDGVSLTTSEPGTLAVMLTALAGLGMLTRRRRRTAPRQDGPAIGEANATA